MDTFPTDLLIGLLVALIFLSAFFSSSETGMLSLNRYRLRHLVKKKHKGAVRAAKLLERPDRLIGVILIGNNLVNIFATLIAGAVTTHLFGEWATVVVLPIVLTLVILIFAEVTPKSLAAVYPEKIAFTASLILLPLLFILYPIVLLVNSISNGLARMFGLDPSKARKADHLRMDELRTVVDEAGELIPDQHQGMLLNVLDLEKATVEDIMVPRNEVEGIDLEDDIKDILAKIRSADYTRLPVYTGDINNIVGILRLRDAPKFLTGNDDKLTTADIRKHLREPYFIPESNPLPTQLKNFQHDKHSMAVVVDEYGEVQGIATLVDLLEEIVGDFTTDAAEDAHESIVECADDWYLIDASEFVRDINRNLGWELPTDGPKTINGIIVEYLENIPDANVSFEIDKYRFEIAELSETRIEKARISELAI
ncbi:HlyC/CorC family transporter [Teredinibacter franksiae]|uniref:HlyC/CorC family transporter n=1 Tax=Teredinibacter franksiae TaxID=2761453 RepID=UPI001629CF0F|nr:HlyC/CorC family transporter [Teredinibacter franksiae]